jgi:hypothetical protein
MKFVSLGIDCAMASALDVHLNRPEAYKYPFSGLWLYHGERPNSMSLVTIAKLIQTRFDRWGESGPGFRSKPVSKMYDIEFTHGHIPQQKVQNFLDLLDSNEEVVFCQMFRLYSFDDLQIKKTRDYMLDAVDKFRSTIDNLYPNLVYSIKMFDLCKDDKQHNLLRGFTKDLDIGVGFPRYGRFSFGDGRISTSFYGIGWESAFKEAGVTYARIQ